MTTWIFRLANASAIIGAIALCLLTLMTIVSIVGSMLAGIGFGPVPGEFELVEVTTAVAVFFFLPWTEVCRGHATVGILYDHFSKGVQKALQVISSFMMLALWLVFTWKLWDGLVEKREFMETTFILQIPLWWAYALCMVGAVIGCLVYVTVTLIQLGLAKQPEQFLLNTAVGH